MDQAYNCLGRTPWKQDATTDVGTAYVEAPSDRPAQDRYSQLGLQCSPEVTCSQQALGPQMSTYTNWAASYVPGSIYSEGNELVMDPNGFWRPVNFLYDGWAACEEVCGPTAPPPSPPATAPAAPPCSDVVVTLWNPTGLWSGVEMELAGHKANLTGFEGEHTATVLRGHGRRSTCRRRGPMPAFLIKKKRLDPPLVEDAAPNRLDLDATVPPRMTKRFTHATLDATIQKERDLTVLNGV